MKKILLFGAIAIMTVMSATAQKIKVMDADGNALHLVSVLTEKGHLIGTTDLNGEVADVKGAPKILLTHVAFKPKMVAPAELTDGRIIMEEADLGIDEIVVKPKPYIYVEYYFRGFRYIGDSLRAYGAGILPVAFDLKKHYTAKTHYVSSMGIFANKARGWHRAEISYKATETAKRSNGHATENWLRTKRAQEIYGISLNQENNNRWRVEIPNEVVGQIVHDNGRTFTTLNAGRMQRYQDEKEDNEKLMKRRQETNYAYEYADIYQLPNEDNDDIPDLARLEMSMNHWEYSTEKGRHRDIYYLYVVCHSYVDEKDFKARCKELNRDHVSDMTLEELQAYEQQHNIPALDSKQIEAIEALKLHP